MTKPKHVTLLAKSGKLSMSCGNCGAKEVQDLPAFASTVENLGKMFIKNHTRCKLGNSKK
jgi:hypothetical protein